MNRSIRAYSTTSYFAKATKDRHDKFLLFLIATSSCASLMGMDEAHTQIIPAASATHSSNTDHEDLQRIVHDRRERMLNDEEHIQLHAGKAATPQPAPALQDAKK